MKKIKEIQLTIEEAEAMTKRLDQKEMTDEDKLILISLLNVLRTSWWARCSFKIFTFFKKIDRCFGLKGKYTWLTGPIKK